jgi:NADPH:quinone reductase
MTHVIQYARFGGPEVLELADEAVAASGPGEAVVRLAAVGVNPVDAKQRAGLRGGDVDAPRRLGADGAGTVIAVGPGTDGFRVGDEVVVFGVLGTYAEELVVPVQNLQPRPPHVSAAVGAAVGVPFGTAHQVLRSLDAGPGDTVLVHAGSGAVGQAVVQFAVLSGATVVATASPRRHDRLRELGAIPVAYGDGLEERVRDAAPGGVTAVVDAAGTDEAIEVSLALVADRSRIATIVRGKDADALGIRGFLGGSPHPLTPQELAWRAEAMPLTLALLSTGRFSVELGPSFPLAEAADAHRAIADGADGKITLVP